jgi:hypothetical protein
MKQGNVSAKSQRLNLILNMFDQAAYECKQKIMRTSAKKDNDLKPMSRHYLIGAIHEHFESMNWVDIMCYAAMLLRHEDINKGLAKITPTETIDG